MPQADSSRDATAANTPSSSIMEKDVEKEGIPAESSVSEREPTNIAEKSDNSEDVVATPPQTQQPVFDPSAFPDGGFKAWTVVAGAFASLFVSFGWINCE